MSENRAVPRRSRLRCTSKTNEHYVAAAARSPITRRTRSTVASRASGLSATIDNNAPSESAFNQRVGGDDWFLIGEWDFAAGTSGNVVIRNNGTDQTVVADAVRFISVNKPDPPPACIQEGYRCQQALCPTGDCFAPLNGDDPTSKFFQGR